MSLADPRAELQKAIESALNSFIETAEQREAATAAVMKLFWRVTESVDEHETTTYGDAREQYIWSRSVVAEHAVESGSYSGKPRIR